MRRDSKQQEELPVPNRSVVMFLLDVKKDGKLIGHGFVFKDAFSASRPTLADFAGNPLNEELYELHVTDEVYHCVINSMVH